MDFFEHQDRARTRTNVLIFYFILAVIGIIFSVYAALVFLLGITNKSMLPGNWWQPDFFLYTTVATTAVILIGSFYKMATLRHSSIAVSLGGRPVDINTTDIDERKLINVVEEMALASGVPTPEIYILGEGSSINAFAAGYSPENAVIGVTRCCIRNLNRDELQGVVAHEFSHILNGDMRLNIHLIGWLFGILCLAVVGRILLRSASSSGSRKKNPLPLIGLALILIGYIGVFFARLIQSAVSRQREFLADASAVQFTRNSDGIANALKKIGGLENGSRLGSPHAEEASHLFFADGIERGFFSNLFSTHPPLTERIRAIDSSFNGEFVRIELKTDGHPLPEMDALRRSLAGGVSPDSPAFQQLTQSFSKKTTPNALIQSVGMLQQRHIEKARQIQAGMPDVLLQAAHEPLDASALVYCSLLEKDADIRAKQWAWLEQHVEPAVIQGIKRLLPSLTQLDVWAVLPLINLSIPALRRLSKQQYDAFSKNVCALIHADENVSLFEYTLQRMLLQHLRPSFEKTAEPRVRFYSINPVLNDCALLVSALANLQTGEAKQQEAFARGMRQLNTSQATQQVKSATAQTAFSAIDKALERINASEPFIKRNALYACASAVASDGMIEPKEIELLRAIASSLDCPIPPFVSEMLPA
ncbi:MAG: M48 family metallopeptidase [bacterium]